MAAEFAIVTGVSTGALIAYSGKKTGRSPTDKRVVEGEARLGANDQQVKHIRHRAGEEMHALVDQILHVDVRQIEAEQNSDDGCGEPALRAESP